MSRIYLQVMLSFLFVALVQGCAADLSQELEVLPTPDDTSEETSDGSDAGPSTDDETTNEQEEETPRFTHFERGDGATLTLVDATRADSWAYFDLDLSKEMHPSQPTDDATWDLAFQRYKVKLNGGYHGTGDVMAVAIEGVSFSEVTQAPLEGWEYDRRDLESDEDEDPEFVLGSWYDYNPSTHVLSPASVVYIVRTAEGAFYKLAFAGYYDASGDSGFPSFNWASVEPPAGDIIMPVPEQVGDTSTGDSTVGVDEGGDDSTTDDRNPLGEFVDAAESDSWTYLSLSDGVVLVDDEATSLVWDVAILRTAFRTNGGTSGSGIAAVAAAPSSASYGDQETADTLGYFQDVMITPSWPEGADEFSGNELLGDWYDYDFSTHEVEPKDTFFFLRTAMGHYAKLQVHSYQDGIYDISWDSLQRLPVEHTSSFDVGYDDSWVYLSLRTGELLEDEDGSGLAWDLGFSGTKVRTNGGTSGAGIGGVVTTDLTGLADVSFVTTEVPTPDGEMTFEGAGGTTVTSANPALDGWFDYNPETHAVTSKGFIYQIATADGDFAKVRFESYEAGQIQISWVYAGPGEAEY